LTVSFAVIMPTELGQDTPPADARRIGGRDGPLFSPADLVILCVISSLLLLARPDRVGFVP
jgi:hypothetical protein